MSTFTHQLPCGIINDDGQVKRGVHLVGMSGKVRRLITQKQIRANPTKIVDTILNECIVVIEGVGDRDKERVIRGMLNGDRDWCAHRIREIGKRSSTVTCDYTCQACDHKDTEEVDLSKIQIYGLSDAPGVPMPDTQDGPVSYFTEWSILDDGGKPTRAYRLVNEALEIDCHLRWPTGDDFEAIQKIQEAEPERANFVLFSRCLMSWRNPKTDDASPSAPGSFKWTMFDHLDDGQVTWLEDEWGKRQVGPEVFYPITCIGCGQEAVVTLAASDFLFPRLQKVASRRRSFHKST